MLNLQIDYACFKLVKRRSKTSRFSLFLTKKKLDKTKKYIQDFGSNICILSKNSVSVLIAYGNKAQLLRNKLAIVSPLLTLLLLFIKSQKSSY